jgi:uncharacterized protein (DUF2141 family)
MKTIFVSALLLAATSAASETLTVKVSGAGTGGQIVAAIYGASDGFSGFDTKKAASVQMAPVAGGGATITFTGLKPGKYSVSAFHDADKDGKLKTNFIGMPKEAVGVSNNPGGMPSYSKSQVSVPAAGPIEITLRKIG